MYLAIEFNNLDKETKTIFSTQFKGVTKTANEIIENTSFELSPTQKEVVHKGVKTLIARLRQSNKGIYYATTNGIKMTFKKLF